MATEKQMETLIKNRTKMIDKLLKKLEKKVSSAQADLLDDIVTNYVDRLEFSEDGKVRNTLANKRLLATIDTIFNRFGNTLGVEIANVISNGVFEIVDFQSKYFSPLAPKSQLLQLNKIAIDTVKAWLGLTPKGNMMQNGYLHKIVSVDNVRSEIKDIALRGVVGQQGWNTTRLAVKDYIKGTSEDTGALNRYYRNFVYDTYSQVDRASAQIYADKLGFNFAIYEGGLIKTSRKFCRDHNGKVYHRSEIEQFNPKEAKPPNYNPFTDLGGYACRHHLNWIPDSLAVIMRKDASKFLEAA